MSKNFEIEPLFEETLDFSELNGLKGGLETGTWNGTIGLLVCMCNGSGNGGSKDKGTEK